MSSSDKTSSSSVLLIHSHSSWFDLGLRELWDYRDLLWFHVWREIKGKYRQMALGPLWIILQPIMHMIVFSFLFGRVAKLSSDGIPYVLMVYSAMVPWTFFSNACSAAVGSLVSQMGIISKVYFPRLIIPMSSILGGLIDFVLSFAVFFAIMLGMGYFPGWQVLFLPLYLLLAVACALSLGLWTASLTVQFRDLRLVVQYGMQIAMYVTPVAYSSSEIARKFPDWMWLYQLNPMYWVIEGFRWCLFNTGTPPQPYMLLPIALTIVTAATGMLVFRKTERSIVDLL